MRRRDANGRCESTDRTWLGRGENLAVTGTSIGQVRHQQNMQLWRAWTSTFQGNVLHTAQATMILFGEGGKIHHL